jgi:hypothetical protein
MKFELITVTALISSLSTFGFVYSGQFEFSQNSKTASLIQQASESFNQIADRASNPRMSEPQFVYDFHVIARDIPDNRF